MKVCHGKLLNLCTMQHHILLSHVAVLVSVFVACVFVLMSRRPVYIHMPIMFNSPQILRRCEGSIELVDVSSELPQLIRRPGLKKWKVSNKF